MQRALTAGELVIVPTDTVYGIAAHALDEDACARLAHVKGRPPGQPIAVIFATIAALEDALPTLSRRAWIAAQMLLPGPYTLVVSNPERRMPWLCGTTPEAIGVRVPEGALDLPPMAATSANIAGEPEIEAVAQLPADIAAHVACAIDGGVLESGNPSTVLDLTSWEAGGEVRVLRDPSGRAGDAITRLAGVAG